MEKDSKISVLGANGLVGSGLVNLLQFEGYKYVSRLDTHNIDLSSTKEVRGFFFRARPEYVFLCAARVGGINANNLYPVDFLFDNLKIQMNVIEAAADNYTKKLLFLGSSCIYPKYAHQPMSERHLMAGPLEPTNSAYAIAKIAGIEMCKSYNKQYRKNFICAMPTNLYGNRDNFSLIDSHVLPAMIRKFHEAKINNNKSVTLWGDGSPKRELLHVNDLSSALIFLMKNFDAKSNDILINVGIGKDISIKDLAYLVKDIIKYEGDILWDGTKPNGTPKKLLDTSKINSLGWYPEIELETGIKMTYEWFVNNYENIRK